MLTVLLGIIMLSFSWYTQNEISLIKQNIEVNIESRDLLIEENHQARDDIWQARDLLFKFQADPQQFKDQEIISSTISHAIPHIVQLLLHPWIKKNYNTTISDLVSNLNDIDEISKKLIDVRLTPQKLFPALKIANTTMQPLNATVIENIQLATKDIEDNYTSDKYNEYRTLIELRFYWTTLISNFRMCLLNQVL